MRQNDDRPYEVGKGKPPKKHRWQPGQSGNPRGPKRKADRDKASMTELLADIINSEAEAVIGNRAVKLSKGDDPYRSGARRHKRTSSTTHSSDKKAS